MIKLLVLVFGGLKLGKVFFSAGTMLVSLVVYAQMWGWKFASGFLMMLFVHELGHFVAARQRQLAVGLPTFIPFVGAWIELKEQPMDAETEAYVAIAGPIAGSLAAVATYFLAREQSSGLLLAVAYSGLFLNLFNLIPVSPLDGGRIVGIISPKLWLIGVPILLAVFIWRPNPLIIVLGIVCVPQVLKAWRYDPNAPENERYYSVAPATKLEYGALYLGLACFLAIMTYELHQMLESFRA